MPEKRVQSFAFYMGDAQPKNLEKGVGGDSACLKLSWDRGDWGKVKGREAYVSLFHLCFSMPMYQLLALWIAR